MNQHLWKIIVQAAMVALIFIEKWIDTKEKRKRR